MTQASAEMRDQLVSQIRRFVEREVIPKASYYDHNDEYPHALVEQLKELGLFGAIVPEEYGGSGLDFITYTMVVEEIARGWMSLTGVLNTHLLFCYALLKFGTEEQKKYYLPKLATGEMRGGLGLTEPGAGSDVQAIQTWARREGDNYVINGAKMFITNAMHGHIILLAAKTDRNAQPPHRGISLFLAEKGHPGFKVMREIEKLGYHSLDTCELLFEDYEVPATNLLGGVEGQGFRQVMASLEVGRLNVAARGVGLAQAAFEAAIRYSQQRHTFGVPISQHQAIQLKLADMGTKVEAARQLLRWAAAKKDAGERCDMEAGMAKLFATEIAQENTLEAMRVFGGVGYTTELPVERYYRDSPLLIIGEGTNEIQRLVIARRLLERYAI